MRERTLSHLRNIDEELAKRVADGLSMDLPAAAEAFKPAVKIQPSNALSLQKQWKKTLQGRKVGILFAEGSDLKAIEDLKKAIKAKGGTPFTIAPKVGGIKVKGGELEADGQLAGSPSMLFDAVALVLSTEGAAKLAKESAAIDFVMNAFVHLKAIGHTKEAQPLLDKANVEADAGIVDLAKLPEAATLRYWEREPKIRDLA